AGGFNAKSAATFPTRTCDLDPTLYLPLELAEAVLLLVPLRFPLDQIFDASYADLTKMHKDCAAALAVVPRLPRAALALFAPRLANGFAKMMSQPLLFSVEVLDELMANGYRFPPEPAFAAALQHNRVDVLAWWDDRAKLTVPTRYDYAHWDHDPVRLAVTARAWDALVWLTRRWACRSWCVEALRTEDLAFVSMWIRAGYYTVEFPGELLEAACAVGAVVVLQACSLVPSSSRVLYNSELLDPIIKAAVFGRGPLLPVLEWMWDNRLDLTRVTVYAQELEDPQVLEWCKDRIGLSEDQLIDSPLRHE
ncbi:hypothetical protein BCR44DRAFT_1434326, partial [Catenaria anguillulae PL171]